jgi:hypothetical protein
MRPVTGSAKQSRIFTVEMVWIASPHSLFAMMFVATL